MSRRVQSVAVVGLAVGAVAATALGLESDKLLDVVLWCAPLLCLALSLVTGHYAGETLIESCRERRRVPRRRPRLVAQPVPAAAARSRISGGRLIAHSLAQRGPPAPVAFGI
jgi:hypothetical protein